MDNLIDYLVQKYGFDELEQHSLRDGLSIATYPNKTPDAQARRYKGFLRLVWGIKEDQETILSKIEEENNHV